MTPADPHSHITHETWEKVSSPIKLKLTYYNCRQCGAERTGCFIFKEGQATKTIYACSLTCFDKLQKTYNSGKDKE